ncbi:MAG: chemotaxis protein CheW [Candidatus Gastranaerophilales bacterium]|nr:chemotaxis protein CheW [Candidatus Gastranaerophilales bacterium]
MVSYLETKEWLVFRLYNNKYAIPGKEVSSLFQIPDVTVLQNYDKKVRGLIKYQNKIIQLIDIKKVLNIKSTQDEIKEFEELMDARLQDHVVWLKRLEEKVLNDSNDELVTDPHECAFGKWYDSYNPESYNILFISTFKKFDRPHKAIHQIAHKVDELLKTGEKQKAIDLIKAVKDTDLKQMIEYFDIIKQSFKESKKEIVIAFTNGDTILSFPVDEVMSIEDIKDISEETVTNSSVNSNFITAVGKRKNEEVVFIINQKIFFEQYGYKK